MQQVLLLSVLLAACITPRASMLMQTAAPVGPGGVEVGFGTGVGYQTQSPPPQFIPQGDGTTANALQVGRAFAVPAVEGNVQIGVSRKVALNLHASPSGIQPGVKFTLNNSRMANIALLPQVGVGYASYAQSTYTSQANGSLVESAPSSTTALTLQGGLKVLASLRFGLYAGVGYDLVFTRSVNLTQVAIGNDATAVRTTTTSLQHQVAGAIGFSVALGNVRIRPEVGVVVTPLISTVTTVNLNPPVEAAGGFGFLLMPSISVAVVTPRQEVPQEPSEEQQPPDEER